MSLQYNKSELQAAPEVSKSKNHRSNIEFRLTSSRDEQFTILVGPESVAIEFSKSLLINHTPFFRQYFKNDPTSKSISFPDQELQSFNVLSQFLNTGSLPLLQTVQKGSDSFWSWNPLYAYCLALKIQVAPLCDKVMDVWLAHDASENGFPSMEYVKDILRKAVRGSAPWIYARRCMAYYLGVMRHKDDLSTWTTEGVWEVISENKAFGIEVLELQRKGKPGIGVRDPTKAPICEYHAHDLDVPCPNGKKTR